MTSKPVPLSLRKKSSARLAAVQCLYRRRLMGENAGPDALVKDYLEQWQDDKDAGERVLSRDAEPDKSLLRKLVGTAVAQEAEIDSLTRSLLSESWTVERMSPLLLAILACALVELRFAPGLNPAIVIDEYVTITGRFFESAEMGFINGLLDTLAKSSPSSPA